MERPFPRFAAALVLAGLLHVVLFVVLHVRPGPKPAPVAKASTDAVQQIVPYLEATDVQLAPGEGLALAAPSGSTLPAARVAAAPAPATAPSPEGTEPSAPTTAVVSETATTAEAGSGSGAGIGSGGEPSGVGEGSEAGSPTGAAHAAIVAPPFDRRAILAQILARVRAARRYPEAARRRELEGVVHVHFIVGADGRPQSVTTSEGDALLQRAAVEAVERAAPLPLVDGPIDVDLDYRLDASQ